MVNRASKILVLALICLLLALGITVNAQSTCQDAAGGNIPCTTEPDSDGDGFVDSDDRCPFEAGVGVGRGDCGDQDGDFITNDGDLCPDEPGPAETGGCPLPTPTPTTPPTATAIPIVATRIPTLAPVITRCPIIIGFDSDGDCFSIGDLCPDVAGTYLGCVDRESAMESTTPREAGMLLIAFENTELIPVHDFIAAPADEGQTLLLPAVQSAREFAIRDSVSCVEDEELQMTICYGEWGKLYEPLFGFTNDDEAGSTADADYEDADWICSESQDLRMTICYPQYLKASYPPCDECDPGHPPVAMEQVVCDQITRECLIITVAPPSAECVNPTSTTTSCETLIVTSQFDLPETSNSATHIVPVHVAFISSPSFPRTTLESIVAPEGEDDTAAGTGCWSGRSEIGCQAGFGGHFIAVYKQGNMVCYEDSVTGQHCVDL